MAPSSRELCKVIAEYLTSTGWGLPDEVAQQVGDALAKFNVQRGTRAATAPLFRK